MELATLAAVAAVAAVAVAEVWYSLCLCRCLCLCLCLCRMLHTSRAGIEQSRWKQQIESGLTTGPCMDMHVVDMHAVDKNDNENVNVNDETVIYTVLLLYIHTFIHINIHTCRERESKRYLLSRAIVQVCIV